MPLVDQYGRTIDSRTPIERAAERERAEPVPPNPIRHAAQQNVSYASEQHKTQDSYQNYVSHTGFGTDNVNTFGGYGFYPITRLRIILDWAFRSSWVCRIACEAVAEDMTREGFDLGSDDLDPDDAQELYGAFDQHHAIWDRLAEAITWSRLYGGAGIYVMIDGQKPDTPLRPETVGPGQFLGLLPLDRWLVQPSLNELVTDRSSPDFGYPKFYVTVGDTPLPGNTRIHHTRFLRFNGAKLPYYQRLSENMWDMSVLEPIWDRLLAFDMTTASTAQLVNRASLRTLAIENWKEVVGTGGKLLEAQLQAIEWLRRMQVNEGISIIDVNDRIEYAQYTFTGLDAVLIQMVQQLAGALGIPLVRFFGQSPAGLNSTGESDWRNYYDMIRTTQQRRLYTKVDFILDCVARSLKIKLPQGFTWSFNPLWQLQDAEKSSIASQITQTVLSAYEAGIMPNSAIVLKELKQQAQKTNIWTNITEEDIKAAENAPPQVPGMQMPGAEGAGMPPGPPQPGAQPPAGSQPDQFLPGGAAQPSSGPVGEGDAFGGGGEGPDELPSPGGNIRSFLPRRGFLPGGGKQDAAAPEPYKAHGKPIFHVYYNRDKDLPGRQIKFMGHDIVVEREKGETRDEGSSEGAVMSVPYGYFPGTRANDGDALDCFMGDAEDSNRVFVIDQVNPDTREFHQPKVFLGFRTGEAVLDAFNKFYADGRGPQRFGGGKEFGLKDFANWLDRFRIKAEAG
jgi:phage-related protein (TIGR01555 family)